MGRVKTRPEIWPDPRPFWPTRPNPSHFFMDPSNPKKFFYQPENIFSINVSKSSQNWLKKWEKTWPELWPEHNFMNPNQNSLTRDPTRIRSHNPKPDPRAEKRTRPIPNLFILNWEYKNGGISKIFLLFYSYFCILFHNQYEIFFQCLFSILLHFQMILVMLEH